MHRILGRASYPLPCSCKHHKCPSLLPDPQMAGEYYRVSHGRSPVQGAPGGHGGDANRVWLIAFKEGLAWILEKPTTHRN
jgi:hypothetical protein